MNLKINKNITNYYNNPPTKKEYKKSLNLVPERVLLEEIGNSITHGVGALLSIAMFIFMLLKSNPNNFAKFQSVQSLSASFL